MDYRNAVELTIKDTGSKRYYHDYELQGADNLVVSPGDVVVWVYVGTKASVEVEIYQWQDSNGFPQQGKKLFDHMKFTLRRGTPFPTLVLSDAQRGGRHNSRVDGLDEAPGPGIIVCPPGQNPPCQ